MNITQVVNPESKFVYLVDGHLGGTKEFTLYSCIQKATDNKLILKIAKTPKDNALLDREAYILNLLSEEATKQEKAFKKANPKTEVMMNYHFTFPKLLETFISKEQDSRRILILDLSHVANNLGDLTPLFNIEKKDKKKKGHY